VRAADYLHAIGFRGRVYNSFAFGGYLAWRGVAPFQDGRGLLPRGREEAGLLGPEAGARFAELDREYHFDALVLARPEPVPGAPPVTTAGDWIVDGATFALVAFDDGGLLFLRRDGAHADRAERDQYRKVRPTYAPYRWDPAEVPQLLEEYRRSVAEAPGCVVCRYFEASAALAAGKPGEALDAAKEALRGRGPELVNPLRVAARASEALGRNGEARRLYAQLLSTGLDDAGARRGLARVALAAGDPRAAGDALRANLEGARPLAADLELGLEIARRSGAGAEVARLEALLGREHAAAAAEELRRRGLAAFDAGDVPAAAAWLARAVEASESAPVRSELGQVLLALGRADQALLHQRRALELDPGYVPAHYGLGLALGARGDRAGAAAAYRRCIELEPAGVWAIQAAQRLRGMGER
jgi:tetratricopeptide (TPR) repeat protein